MCSTALPQFNVAGVVEGAGNIVLNGMASSLIDLDSAVIVDRSIVDQAASN